jgi:hypothetical protein
MNQAIFFTLAQFGFKIARTTTKKRVARQEMWITKARRKIQKQYGCEK